jgi:hypothetical protein
MKSEYSAKLLERKICEVRGLCTNDKMTPRV